MRSDRELKDAADYWKRRFYAAQSKRNFLYHHQDIKPDQITFGGDHRGEDYFTFKLLLAKSFLLNFIETFHDWFVDDSDANSGNETKVTSPRPPFNAEYLLYLLLRREDRNIVIGDLVEGYGHVLRRFDRRRADIWFYKQVGGSLFPLLRRALLRIGALVWLGRILRRLIS